MYTEIEKLQNTIQREMLKYQKYWGNVIKIVT